MDVTQTDVDQAWDQVRTLGYLLDKRADELIEIQESHQRAKEKYQDALIEYYKIRGKFDVQN